MNARRLVLAAVVSLCSLTAGASLVVPTALAEELCPNAASRQGPSAALPDCRAYEQVTPLDKGDATDMFGSIEGEQVTGTPSEDGSRFLMNTFSNFSGGNTVKSSYVFSRGANGWTTTSLTPGPGVQNMHTSIYSPDLSEVGFEDLYFNRRGGRPEELVLNDDVGPVGGPYAHAAVLPPERGEHYGPGSPIGESMIGASADLSHLVLQVENYEMAPGDSEQDPNGGHALYEYFDGNLKLVNLNTEGKLVSTCGAVLGVGEGAPDYTHNAVSSDGSKIIFTAPDPGHVFDQREITGPGCWNQAANENPPQLYMRVDGSRTIEVSAPAPGVSDPNPTPAVYAGASADDSEVFFVSASKLTADDPAGAPELYEYNTEAPEGERLVRVSGGESGTAEGNVSFVAGVSSDGSTVYFAAYGKLAEGASALPETESAAPSKEFVNLYRYDTVTKKTTYITKILVDTYPTQFKFGWWYEDALKGENTSRRQRIVGLDSTADLYVTDNGKYLLFGSKLPLTGYENSNEPENEKVDQLFRYSAANNSIVCVTCNSGLSASDYAGQGESGEERFQPRFDRAEFEQESLASLPPRPISEDGSYVFFETYAALVPNTADTTLHVYEWHNGTISLISSPDDSSNAFFLGSSPDGSNVFLGTHAQLVPQDTDESGDVYDARIGGGFVGVTPPQCTGTGCQGLPGAPPIFATPASVTFEGVGNFESPPAVVKPKPKAKPAKCKKGFVKKKGKCVKAKAKKKAKKSNRRGK